MKQADVQIGSRYRAKVSGKLVTVRVISMDVVRGRQRFNVFNEATGRKITFRSAQRFRCPLASDVLPLWQGVNHAQ
jgi:hypothetical protein